MVALRSFLFNLAFYVWTAAMCILYLPALALPRRVLVDGQAHWARGVNLLMRWLARIRVEIRGCENLPKGAVIVASKHQSAWDTMIWHVILADPAVVMKQELMWIPIYGWISRKTRMIPVDRKGGGRALRAMLRAARAARDAGRQITIFPEATRSAPDRTNPYHPGVAALYQNLALPVVPAAVNSGLFWPRRSFLRRPGTIVLEFLAPIAPGLDRRPFIAELEQRIETATRRLVAEGRRERLVDNCLE